MADDRKIELPTRDTTGNPHEEPNVVSRPKDTGRIDLTKPKPKLEPDVTIPPDPKPKTDEAPKEEPQESPVVPDDIETLKRKRKELEEDNFKYRDRIRREREEKEILKSRIDRLESSVSHVQVDKEMEEASRKVQEELGIDEDSAKKLTRAFRKINEPKPNQPINEIEKAAKEFSNQAVNAMEDFPDWETHRQKMTELLENDIRLNGELRSLKRGPLYFYAEALRVSQGDPESAKAQGRKEMAEKVNQKNLSVSESSRNSQGRPTIQQRWTRENVQELARTNPEEYAKRRTEIMKAMSSGEIQ